MKDAPFLSPQCEASDLRCEVEQLQDLWQGVIKQAALDLRGPVGHRSKAELEDGVARAVETEKWVRGEPCFPGDATDYFAEVCDLAGVEAAPVRDKILQRIEFPASKRDEIEGLIVEPKYCEVCGKSFLRSQGSKQVTCASCGAREAGRVTQSLASAVWLATRYLESDPEARSKPDKPYLPGDLLRMTCLAANVPNQADAQRRWPWLGEDVDSPCDCENLIVSNALLVLQHLYETHVQTRQDWTPEQLVAWVQKHEQAEQRGEDAQISDRPIPGVICVPDNAGGMERDNAGGLQ
jgi:ribosomal protein L37AE/L43A